MIYCGLDTETTGLPNTNISAKDPKQARVVQLALKLITGDGRVLSQFSTLIKPSGWDEIHPKAFETHGITREDCEKYGMPAEAAFGVFCQYAHLADMFVAHNSQFDEGMMMLEADALGFGMPSNPWHCTMKAATPICKIPPTEAMLRAGRKHHKSANVTEALRIICGKELIGAHDAMNDVSACLDIFVELKKERQLNHVKRSHNPRGHHPRTRNHGKADARSRAR